MSTLCCRPRSPAAKTPLEDDDLLSEILLRLPPQPSSLPRASLVCKRWHSLASDRGFSRRFRIHHRRKPPLLGFFDGVHGYFQPTLEAPNRIPRGRFTLQHGDRFRSLGSRHGLVLIFDLTVLRFLVCDPVTGDQHRIAIPPGLEARAEEDVMINGAVFRNGGDAHFQVVLTTADNHDKQHRQALSCVYSSETGLWGGLISTPLPCEVPRNDYLPTLPTLVFPGKPAVVAGNSIYWMLTGNFDGILEFDLEKQSLAVIRVPVHLLEINEFWIVRAEGGGLGLLFLTGSSIQLWKRKTDHDGVATWMLGRTIKLHKPLSLKSAIMLGYAEENNVVYLWARGDVFMVHLESLQSKKLFETKCPSHYHPFESVYTAETGIGDGHDAADLVHHT
ncbi:uncharacterized protein [Lolium perenne]|uniref:uncharacterized protein n=1 Tax=Lolium perenne TaxID=4522 RepID=UPI0021F551B7|nr:uncharacterized protein LOC127293598 [Lolium perenne]